MEVFSFWHIVIVLIVAAVLFYRGDKLPDMARSVGRSLRVFKTEIKGLAEDDKAREAAHHGDDNGSGAAVNVTKAIEAPAAGQPFSHPDDAAPRVVPQASEPIPVHAEVVRTPASPQAAGAAPRPRPRPAGSAPRP